MARFMLKDLRPAARASRSTILLAQQCFFGIHMKKSIYGLSLVASLILASSPSYAVGTWGGKSGMKDKLDDMVCKLAPKNPHCTGSEPETPTPHSVPEIDAASAGIALALFGGLMAIRRERRNRR